MSFTFTSPHFIDVTIVFLSVSFQFQFPWRDTAFLLLVEVNSFSDVRPATTFYTTLCDKSKFHDERRNSRLQEKMKATKSSWMTKNRLTKGSPERVPIKNKKKKVKWHFSVLQNCAILKRLSPCGSFRWIMQHKRMPGTQCDSFFFRRSTLVQSMCD